MSRKKFSIMLTISLVMLLLVSLYAQVPRLINYQGMLTDAVGNPIRGDVTIEFRIYASETGGTIEWAETQLVKVTDGLFHVVLGSSSPTAQIPLSLFDGTDKYLALKVGTDTEMTPRKRLVSVGYAFRAYDADKVDGKDASAFVQKVDGVLPDATGNVDLVAGSNVTLTPDVAKNQITISATPGGGGDNLGNHTATQNIKLNGHWLSGDGQNEGVFVANDGNVGIGTTNPGYYALNVAGTIASTGNGGIAQIFNANANTAVLNGIQDVQVRTGGDTRVTFKNNGNVGIGTPNPVYTLDVAGTIASTGKGGIAQIFNADANTAVLNGVQDVQVRTGGVTRVTFKNNGNVGIGTTNPSNILTVKQNSSTDPIADAWRTYSSRRWKINIQPIAGALDKVQRLRGVYYDWKVDGKHDIGLIAEEVGEVIPEVVEYEENGEDARGLDYARLVAILIEAVKEQQKEIKELEARLNAIK